MQLQPIRVKAFKWKVHSKEKDFIGGIQVLLSNGSSSPVFLSPGQDESNLTKVNVHGEIRKVRGTKKGISISVREVTFFNQNGD